MIAGADHKNNAKAIEAQAVEWLIARDEHQTWTDEDQKRLDAWLANRPRMQQRSGGSRQAGIVPN